MRTRSSGVLDPAGRLLQEQHLARREAAAGGAHALPGREGLVRLHHAAEGLGRGRLLLGQRPVEGGHVLVFHHQHHVGLVVAGLVQGQDLVVQDIAVALVGLVVIAVSEEFS